MAKLKLYEVRLTYITTVYDVPAENEEEAVAVAEDAMDVPGEFYLYTGEAEETGEEE